MPKHPVAELIKKVHLKRRDLLLLASLVQLTLFVPLTWWVRKHPVDTTDIAITHTLQKSTSPFVRYTARGISTLGGSPRLLTVLLVPTVVALWKVHLRAASLMLVGLAVTNELFKTGMKHIVQRPRPSPLLVHVYQEVDGPGFPSGNVASALTFWGWLFALGMLRFKGTYWQQKAVLSLPALLVMLVGPARIYLGDHWASDVIGGYLFGGWLSSCLWLYLTLSNKEGLVRKSLL